MPLPDEKAAPIVEWANLRQAVQWIAFDWAPIPKAYEDASGRPQSIFDTARDWLDDSSKDEAEIVAEAKSALFLALHEDHLKAEGRRGKASDGGNVEYDQNGFPMSWRSHIYEERHSEIPPSFWEFHNIDWNGDHVYRYTEWSEDPRCPETQDPKAGEDYFAVRIKSADLFRVFPARDSPAPSAPARSSYTTPYIDLLERAIEEFQISATNQPKISELSHWLRKQTVDGEKLSDRLAGAMATILRLPEMQKGRAAKLKGLRP